MAAALPNVRFAVESEHRRVHASRASSGSNSIQASISKRVRQVRNLPREVGEFMVRAHFQIDDAIRVGITGTICYTCSE
jgi:hypothetical protein